LTDIRIGGVVRETLDTTQGELRVGGLVREVLNTGGLATRIAIAGMAREALLRSTALVGPRQYAVTVNAA
jgi:hypothetical protein